jgi:hypothetical protein
MVFLNWLSNGPSSPLHGNPSFALKTSVELEKTFRQFIDGTRDLFDTYVIDVEPHAILGPDPDSFIPEYVRMSHINTDSYI